MDNDPGNRADGDQFHSLVAGRLARRPKGIDRREVRDLSLLLTVSTAAPLAALGLTRGISLTVATLGFSALSAGATGWIFRVLRASIRSICSAAGSRHRRRGGGRQRSA